MRRSTAFASPAVWWPGDALAELDRLVHGRMCRDPLCEQAAGRRRRGAPLEASAGARRPGGSASVSMRMIERPHALHRPERQPHREPPVAVVELRPLGLGAKRAIGVGVLLEGAPHDLAGHGARAHAACSGGVPQPAQVVGDGHPPTARPAAARAPPAPPRRRPSRSGGATAPGSPAAGAGSGPPHGHRLAVELAARADVRRERPHEVGRVDGLPGPVDPPVSRLDLVRVRDPARPAAPLRASGRAAPRPEAASRARAPAP